MKRSPNGIWILPLTPATTFTHKNSEHNQVEEADQKAAYKALAPCWKKKFDELKQRSSPQETEFLKTREAMTQITFQHALKPDLILLDEFQNYAGLLYDKERFPVFQGCLETAKNVLLLSATPYEMRASEVRAMSPFDDGLGLDSAKADNAEPEEDTEFQSKNQSFGQMAQFVWSDYQPSVSSDKLFQHVFCRSERSMFYHIDKESEIQYVYCSAEQESRHIAYAAALYPHYQKAYQDLELTKRFPGDPPDPFIAYVKECPAPASFATRYRSLKGQIGDKAYYAQLQAYKTPFDLFALPLRPGSSLDPFGHSSLALLREQACPEGIEKLLWIPPSGFAPDGDNPFEALRDYTKSLVFGNYRLSTAASACLLSEWIREKQAELIASSGVTQESGEIDVSAWLPEKKPGAKNDYVAAMEAFRAMVCAYLRKHLPLICAVTKESKPQDAVKKYAGWGDLRNVLSEYAFLLGLEPDAKIEKLQELCKQFNAMEKYYGGDGATRVICFRDGAGAGGTDVKIDCQIPCGFAERFTVDDTDLGAHPKAAHQENLQALFNSPFYPFVLASTSVAQEGLDFHNYCHRIVHWSVAKTPVTYEQREGRIDRFLSHMVRKRIAMCIPEGSMQQRVEKAAKRRRKSGRRVKAAVSLLVYRRGGIPMPHAKTGAARGLAEVHPRDLRAAQFPGKPLFRAAARRAEKL